MTPPTTPPSGRRALVTGATGFTGGALARELARRGWAVRALARDVSRARTLSDAGIEVVPGDVADAAAVDRAVTGCTHVFHIAALYRTAGQPDEAYHDTNVRGVENVLASAKRHDVHRTVHCSTIGVHGDVQQIPADEDTPFAPGDIYQRTKLQGELLARAAFANGLPGAVFRPAAIYGPGDLRFLKLFRSIRRGRFVMFGSGEILYHLVYIDDLVAGIIACGERPAALGNVYILAGEEYVTLNRLTAEVAEAVAGHPPRLRVPIWPLMAASAACEALCAPLGIEPPLHRRRAGFFTKNRAFNIDRARRDLGYQPTVGVREGVRRTAEWYREQGLL